ncbi:MAG: Hsp20/alpha crystallin family protein [Anaerolineae bacterium]|nr:Hsp20/alpha crystallin family protein [Anaerolineae bacterium]
MSDESSSDNSPQKSTIGTELEASMSSSTVRQWVIVRHASIWNPPTDIYEHDDRLIVAIEIAGMRDGDFNVTLQGQQLTISGARRREVPSDCAYHQLEIRFGEFRTEVSLPWPVRRDEVSATYRDGFLRVELPRTRKHKVQVVDVSVDE